MREALARIPIARRVVVTPHYLHELSVAEIAAVLRVPIGTVKSVCTMRGSSWERRPRKADATSELEDLIRNALRDDAEAVPETPGMAGRMTDLFLRRSRWLAAFA